MNTSLTLGGRAVGVARVKNFIRFVSFVTCALLIMSCMMMLSIPAFAAEGGDATSSISKAVSDGMKKAYDLITSIILPVGALCFAFAAAKLMVGGRRAMEEGQSRLFIILLVVAGVYLAPIIIQEIGSWFKNVSSGATIW